MVKLLNVHAFIVNYHSLLRNMKVQIYPFDNVVALEILFFCYSGKLSTKHLHLKKNFFFFFCKLGNYFTKLRKKMTNFELGRARKGLI